jgi:hypothetical protein
VLLLQAERLRSPDETIKQAGLMMQKVAGEQLPGHEYI